jgi:hypothetical protein
MTERAYLLKQLRFIALACSIVFAIACGADSPEPTGPNGPQAEASLVGSYDLHSVAGHSVPYTFNYEYCSATFRTGNLTLALDSQRATYSGTETVYHECPGAGPTRLWTYEVAGEWESSSGTIVLFHQANGQPRYSWRTVFGDGTQIRFSKSLSGLDYPEDYQRVPGR